jgi:hypothetical protein
MSLLTYNLKLWGLKCIAVVIDSNYANTHTHTHTHTHIYIYIYIHIRTYKENLQLFPQLSTLALSAIKFATALYSCHQL